MLGIPVIFNISWVLLWFTTKEHIIVLGFKPTTERVKDFAKGFLFMAICCLINLLGQAYFKEINYVQNPDYGWADAWSGIGWIQCSAFGSRALVVRMPLLSTK